jgi:hypothetical protein
VFKLHFCLILKLLLVSEFCDRVENYKSSFIETPSNISILFKSMITKNVYAFHTKYSKVPSISASKTEIENITVGLEVAKLEVRAIVRICTISEIP